MRQLSGNCLLKYSWMSVPTRYRTLETQQQTQNFGNSTADISILGQFQTYLQFKGKKYLNTFIVTNANDCPNLLSNGATFRMGVLKPNYPRENVVQGDEVPNFKIGKSTCTSNVFQILQDLRLKQHLGNFEPKAY